MGGNLTDKLRDGRNVECALQELGVRLQRFSICLCWGHDINL